MNHANRSRLILVVVCVLVPLFGPASILAQEPAPITELLIGDPAPPLPPDGWIRGGAITAWKPGTIYVIDFWATWCLPCIQEMPQFQALADEFPDGDLVVIGAETRRQPGTPTPQSVLARHEGLDYPIVTDDHDVILNTWILPSGTSGMPVRAIVDGQGRVAYVGEIKPQFDHALEQVRAGAWDLEAARVQDISRRQTQSFMEEAIAAHRAGDFERALSLLDDLIASDPESNLAYRGFQYEILAADLGDVERASELARRVIEEEGCDNAFVLFVMAYRILDTNGRLSGGPINIDLSLSAAERASELTSHQDIDTEMILARALNESGDRLRARAVVEQASSWATEAQMEQLERLLESIEGASSE